MGKIANIRNIIAKTFLMILGVIVMLSLFWGYILQGFNLNESEIKEWTRTDWILLTVSFVFLVGAAYFNKILDFILTIPERMFNKK